MLLAACGQQQPAESRIAIDCRFPGTAALVRDCTMERVSSPEGTVLVLRRPDASFHRVLVVKDGRGVIAADGAEPVQVTPGQGKTIDIGVDGGIFRLPAKIAP